MATKRHRHPVASATSAPPVRVERGTPYCPPILSMFTVPRCSLCSTFISEHNSIHWSCNACGFLVCTDQSCTTFWSETKNEDNMLHKELGHRSLAQVHSEDICPLQAFDKAKIIQDNAFRMKGEAMLNAMMIHSLARSTMNVSDEQRVLLYNSLRQPGQMKVIAGHQPVKSVPMVDKISGIQMVDPKTREPLFELIPIKNRSMEIDTRKAMDAVSDMMYSYNTMHWYFALLATQVANTSPDIICQLVQLFHMLENVDNLKRVAYAFPDQYAKMDLVQQRVVDEAVVLLDFMSTKSGLVVEPFSFKSQVNNGVMSHVPNTPEESTLLFHDLTQTDIAFMELTPINVCYFIRLVYHDDTGKEDSRNASTNVVVRLMGGGSKPAKPKMLVTQVHSDMYNLNHWNSGNLYDVDIVKAMGHKEVANEVEDFEVVTIDSERVTHAKATIMESKSNPQDGKTEMEARPPSMEEFFISRRLNFLDQKCRFQGLKEGVEHVTALAMIIKMLTDRKSSSAVRAEMYRQLTGVRYPASLLQAPFSAIIARANLVI